MKINSANGFLIIGKNPIFNLKSLEKVGKIPIPTNPIKIISIGKIPISTCKKIGKNPIFAWLKVGKIPTFETKSFFLPLLLLLLYIDLINKLTSRSTKKILKNFWSVRSFPLPVAALCMSRERRCPPAVASGHMQAGYRNPIQSC